MTATRSVELNNLWLTSEIQQIDAAGIKQPAV
jgi:hypothetical protein